MSLIAEEILLTAEDEIILDQVWSSLGSERVTAVEPHSFHLPGKHEQKSHGGEGPGSIEELATRLGDLAPEGVKWNGNGQLLLDQKRSMVDWDGGIFIEKKNSEGIKQALAAPKVPLTKDQLTSFYALNHERIHLLGDSDPISYSKSSGRFLEEGLTENLARRTTVEFVTSLGFVVEPGLKPTPISYGDEARMIEHLASRTGSSDTREVLERWKYQTPSAARLSVVVADITKLLPPEVRARAKEQIESFMEQPFGYGLAGFQSRIDHLLAGGALDKYGRPIR